MTDPRLPFFLYGTLLPGECNHGLLRGRSRSWTPAELPGALLFDGPGHPYAVTDPGGSAVVRGELAEVPAESYEEVLAALDRLEEYVPGGNLYERRPARVRGERGEATAWTYLAGERLTRELRLSGRLIASGDWRDRGAPPAR